LKKAAGEERGGDAGDHRTSLQQRHGPAASERRQRELRHARREERAEWATFAIVGVATDVEGTDAIQDKNSAETPGGSRRETVSAGGSAGGSRIPSSMKNKKMSAYM
jgi:hypothetical protein